MASRNILGYLVGVSLLALATSAATAKAATLVGLTADNKLVKIDTATMAASAPMAISGADQVVGIDVRPADGKNALSSSRGATGRSRADGGRLAGHDTPVSDEAYSDASRSDYATDGWSRGTKVPGAAPHAPATSRK